MEKTTSHKYAVDKGAKCPCCGATFLAYTEFVYGEEGPEQGVNCRKCNAEWTDYYRLAGYYDLKEKNGSC